MKFYITLDIRYYLVDSFAAAAGEPGHIQPAGCNRGFVAHTGRPRPCHSTANRCPRSASGRGLIGRSLFGGAGVPVRNLCLGCGHPDRQGMLDRLVPLAAVPVPASRPHRVQPGCAGGVWPRRLAGSLKAVEKGVTAVCAYNDDVAFALLMSATEAGLSVPDDLSLLGVDDSYLGRMTRPALSTIAFDLAAQAEKLAALITSETDAEDISSAPNLLKLHIRGSVRDYRSPVG